MRKLLLLTAVLLFGCALMAGDEPPPPSSSPHSSQGQGGGRGDKSRRQPREFFAWMDPKVRSELRELQRTDPEEFEKKMAKLVKQYNAEKTARDSKLNELVKTYQTSSDKADKDKAYAEIRKMTEEEFERNLKEQKRQLEFLENRLKAERERYETRSKNAQAIIQARLDELTQPSELRW